MADDLRLPQPAEVPRIWAQDGDDGTATKPLPTTGAGCLVYISQPTGQIEWRHQWIPKETKYSYDPVNGNKLTASMRIRSTDYFKAVPGILGWAEGVGVFAGPNGALKRRLPIRDPDGQGMVATRITNAEFESTSPLKPGPLVLVNGGVPSANQTPRLPNVPSGQADFFRDDCYTSPNVFEFQYLSGGGVQEAIKQSRYCKLQIEFSHTRYPLAADSQVYSGGNPFGAGDERLRHMWSQWDPSMEVVMSKTLTLKFAAGAVDGNGIAIPAGTICATESPFLRPAGTLLLHWEMVPVEALAILLSKYEFEDKAGFGWPLYGCVNREAFKVPMYNSIRTYPAETLMFLGCRPEPRYYAHGYLAYTLTYVFAYRGWTSNDPAIRGWNCFLTGRNEKPQPVVRQDGTKPYRPGPFDELFRTD